MCMYVFMIIGAVCVCGNSTVTVVEYYSDYKFNDFDEFFLLCSN